MWGELSRTILEGLIEPLRGLFKDEVRAIGRKLSLPGELVNSQPFPGAGLAVRILGEITPEKLEILREADSIVCEEIGEMNNPPSQFLELPSRATYDHRICATFA